MTVYYTNEATAPVYYDVWSTDGRYLYSTWNLPFVNGDTGDEEETDFDSESSGAEHYADDSSSDTPTQVTDWIPHAPVYDKWSTDSQYSTSAWRSTVEYSDTGTQEEEYSEYPELTSYDEDYSSHLSQWQVTNLIDDFDRLNMEPTEQPRPNLLQEVKYICVKCGYVYDGQDERYMEYCAYSDEESCQTDGTAFEDTDSGSDRYSSDECYTSDPLMVSDLRLQAEDGVTLLLPAPVTEDFWRNPSHPTWAISEDEYWAYMEMTQHFNPLLHEIEQEGDQLLSNLSSINLCKDQIQ